MAGYVFIGDDFTGASDTLATIAERGHRARLFLDAPTAEETAQEQLDAVGIATDLRALSAEAIGQRLRAMAPQLKALDPRILHYKVCSTFDSSPSVGNIGTAVWALEEMFDPALTLIVGGQPSLGRYCLFGNLFARGPNGAVHRIDRHPIMSRHPTTPMSEADLRQHLAAQGLERISLEPWAGFADGPAMLRGRLQNLLHGQRRVLLDAVRQDDLEMIGAAMRALAADHRLLVVGASSVAEAVFEVSCQPTVSFVDRKPAGPSLVVVGSRSSTSVAQIEAATRFTRLPILPQAAAGEGSGALAGEAGSALRKGENVLLHLLAKEDYGRSPHALSEYLAELIENIAGHFPLRSLAIAGGDTSSVVSRRLGFHSLEFEMRMDAGVCICRSRALNPSRNNMRLLLKGGQVGRIDIFDAFA